MARLPMGNKWDRGRAKAMIRIEHLSKHYGPVLALDDLSLEVPRGAIYGLIGPNGAGKTTLLRILAALIPPAAGQAWIDDIEVMRSPAAVHARIGYMPDFFGVYPDLTAVEYLAFYAGIQGIPRRNQASIITDLLELVDLSDKRGVPVAALSRGMKQRLCLARALVHDPEVLLLDEPASGLDPRARVEFRELLRTLQGMGKTILISSQILHELAGICSDMAIISSGRLVMAGTTEHMMTSLDGGRQIEVRVLERAQEARQLLKDMPGISSVVNEDGDANLIIASFTGDDQALQRILPALLVHEIPVISFGPRRAGDLLEEVYLSTTEGESAL